MPRLEEAVHQTHARNVVCAGGVAANSFLRAALSDMAKRTHTRLFLPPLKLCGDNAAMIGAQAYYEYLAGHLGHTLQNAYPTADIGRNICDKPDGFSIETTVSIEADEKPRPSGTFFRLLV